MSHGHPIMSYQSNHLVPIRIILRIPLKMNLFEITESGTPGFQNDSMGLGPESKPSYGCCSSNSSRRFEGVGNFLVTGSQIHAPLSTLCSTAHQPFIPPNYLLRSSLLHSFITWIRAKKSPCHHAILHACLILTATKCQLHSTTDSATNLAIPLSNQDLKKEPHDFQRHLLLNSSSTASDPAWTRTFTTFFRHHICFC